MQVLDIEDLIRLKKSVPIVDVRSPGEFAEGHVPNAANIPIFDDRERSIVGTIYQKRGRTPAIEKGLELVGPKMAGFVQEALRLAPMGQLLVYCWRGGMRSESMAWLFERIGTNCFTLQGGYKSYRNLLLEKIGEIPRLIVIDGFTGSGKTEVLLSLKGLGEQVIDLEGIAHHKGSVFGGIGQLPQPTTQQFQNDLFDEVLGLDLTKRVWTEGESQTIGRVFLPDSLWRTMNMSPTIEISVPRADRIGRLVNDYGSLPFDLMENSMRSLVKRLGDQRTKEVLQYYSEKDLYMVADHLLEYYDRAYMFSREKYKKKYGEINFPNGDPSTNAQILLDWITDKY